MDSEMTNRTLYTEIVTLVDRFGESERTLEAFLRTIHRLVQPHRNTDGVLPGVFLELLEESFTQRPGEFDPEWKRLYTLEDDTSEGFQSFERLLLRQIVDLREMEAVGILSDEYRYFGVTAPRGSYWYNFDPLTYLECAAAGALGGWRPGDETDREFVPGKVAVLQSDGSVVTVDPQDIPHVTRNLLLVSWALFREFLFCGQSYE